MSRELGIAVDPSSVERAPTDLAVVPLHSAERPLRGAAGRADWRLCGKLSALLMEGRLEGAPGEAALIASFGGLRAPFLLVLGVGERAGFDARAVEVFARDAVARGLSLGARTLSLPFPDDRAGSAAQEERAAALLVGAAEAVGAADAPAQLELHLLVSGEEVTRTTDLLRRARLGRIPEGVAIRLPVSSGHPTGVSPDARRAMPPGARN